MKKLCVTFLLIVFMFTGCSKKQDISNNTDSDNATTMSSSNESNFTEENTTIPTSTEENTTITSVLKNGFSMNNVENVSVYFDSNSNTYTVLMALGEKATTFDDMWKNNQWDNYKSTFLELSNKVTKVAKSSDESSNYRIICTVENVALLICDGDSYIFDIYNSEVHEKISAMLESIAYNLAKFTYAEVLYDANDNMYTLKASAGFSKKELLDMSSEDLNNIINSVPDTAKGIYNMVALADKNMKFTFQLLDEIDKSLLITVYNDEITYNYFEE